jgi:ubiquinone biosynthesis protein
LVGISVNPEHLKRYKDIARLLIRYGRRDLVSYAGLDEISADDEPRTPTATASDPAELAADLEKMGPTFIKLGQLLSTRPDLLPMPYIEALARLQDKVEPVASDEVERVLTEELGVRISKAFQEFDPTPLAAASLGQVHRARMRDGRLVAVKVQRPGIRQRVREDLDALEDVAQFLDRHTEAGQRYEFGKLLEEFRKSVRRELDYRVEAGNLAVLAEHLLEFDRIMVPAPIEDYTTSRVLTMEYVRGRKITSLGPLARLDIDGVELTEQLFRAYLKQILVDGFFHADPHPGNVFLTDDGRIALLDLGMVARLTPGAQDKLLQLLIAVGEGRGDDAAEVAIRIGERRDGFDEMEFRGRVGGLVAEHHGALVGQIKMGRIMLEVARISSESRIRVPSEFTLLGKTLLNLDQVAVTLAPDFDANDAIRRHAADMMRRRIAKSLSPGHLLSGLIDLKEFVAMLPRRVNQIFDLVASNALRIRVDAIDEQRLLEGLQKIANRIALGLVLAALIVGAAMLMSVPTSFRIFGYPGLAMLLFIAAAAGGVGLVISIVVNDVQARRKGR